MSCLNSCLFPIWLQNLEMLLVYEAGNKCLNFPAVELLETVFLQMILFSPFVACRLQYPPGLSNTSWIRDSWYGVVSMVIGHMG